MAWTPISNAVIQYSKDAAGTSASGYYLKFYQSGTSTPFSMASASDGTGLLSKCQINSLGYPINGSGDVFTPYVDQGYRIVLYTNSTDADANTFASAAFDVDGFSALSGYVTKTELAALQSSTLAEAVANTDLQVGQVIAISDRAYGEFDVVLASSVTPNTFDIVQCTTQPALALKLRVHGSPILEQFGVSTTATATFNAGAIQRSIDLGGGYVTGIDGVVDFDVPILQVGSANVVLFLGDCKLRWTGSTAATAYSLGDGVTSTQANKFYNFRITDASGGVNTLLHLNKANRNTFYSKVMTADGLPTTGTGLKMTDSFINTFYSAQYYSFNNVMEWGDDTNGNNWYDVNMEGAQGDGLVVPTGKNINRNSFFGGVIEGIAGDAVHLTSPPNGLTFVGTYFEDNGNDIKCDHTASAVIPLVLRDTRHLLRGTPVATRSAIVVSAACPAKIIAERADVLGVTNDTLFDVQNASAWCRAIDCISKTGQAAFSSTSVGNLIEELFNGANLRKPKLRSFELAGIRVPVAQSGTTASLAAGASVTITFTTPFKNAPFVMTQIASEHTLGTASTVVVVGTTINEVTIRNRGTEAATIKWVAFDMGDLN